MKEIEVENHDEIRRLVIFDEEKFKKWSVEQILSKNEKKPW